MAVLIDLILFFSSIMPLGNFVTNLNSPNSTRGGWEDLEQRIFKLSDLMVSRKAWHAYELQEEEYPEIYE